MQWNEMADNSAKHERKKRHTNQTIQFDRTLYFASPIDGCVENCLIAGWKILTMRLIFFCVPALKCGPNVWLLSMGFASAQVQVVLMRDSLQLGFSVS